jgi:hypothetical protein
MKILVEKATIQLMPEESLQDFLNILENKSKEYTMKKLKIKENTGGYAWLVAAFDGNVIVAVYGKSNVQDDTGEDRFYKIKYTREGDEFKFADMKEVEQKINYTPKNLSDAFSDVEKNTNKAMWNNILR